MIAIYHLPSVYSCLLGIYLFFVELNPFSMTNKMLFSDQAFLSMFSFLFQKLKRCR